MADAKTLRLGESASVDALENVDGFLGPRSGASAVVAMPEATLVMLWSMVRFSFQTSPSDVLTWIDMLFDKVRTPIRGLITGCSCVDSFWKNHDDTLNLPLTGGTTFDKQADGLRGTPMNSSNEGGTASTCA